MTEKTYRKLRIFVYMLALTASILIFTCGFTSRLPEDVRINGVDVGGMRRAEAVAAVREKTESFLREKNLEVRADEHIYTYSYPEIYYRDDLNSVVGSISKRGNYEADIRYYLCAVDQVVSGICAAESVEKVEPYAVLRETGAPFDYYSGTDGRRADGDALKKDIEGSLKGGFEPVYVRYDVVRRRNTLAEVKKNTLPLSCFTTYYDAENKNRSANIALAASEINGTTVRRGEIFSFNSTVGERTTERGYRKAHIIENGEFVEGVGGGVCQVSTTVYNAALLAGMRVTEYHPHSLAVGYVPPSRDAMVSGRYFDMKFENSTDSPVYIRARTENGSLTVNFYGRDSGVRYSLLSEVTGNIPAPVTQTLEPDRVRVGKDGLLSQSFLVISRNGYEKRVLLRKDKYLPVTAVVLGDAQTGAQAGICGIKRKILRNV